MLRAVRILALPVFGFCFLIAPTSSFAQSCGEAVGGTVSVEGSGYCDIYQRQIEYRTKTKEFRKSLEARRDAYEKPHFEVLENYRNNLEKIYEEETEAYQAELAAAQEEASEDMAVEEEVVQDEQVEASEGAGEAEAPPQEGAVLDGGEEAPGLKEKIIGPESDAPGAPVEKIIMPEDAPDF